MNRIEPTRGLALQVWWAFLWRAVLGTLAGGFGVGVVIGVLAPLLALSRHSVENLVTILGVVIGLSVSIEMMYRVLRKRFKTFEVALLAKDT